MIHSKRELNTKNLPGCTVSSYRFTSQLYQVGEKKMESTVQHLSQIQMACYLFAVLTMTTAVQAASRPIIGVMEHEDLMAVQAIDKLSARDRLTLQKMEQPMDENEYDRVQNVYHQLDDLGIGFFIGSLDKALSMATEKRNKPLLTTALSSGGVQENVFHMLPRPDEIAEALLDVIDEHGWKSIGVVYETTLDSEVLTTIVNRGTVDMKFWKVHYGNRNQVREIVQDMRNRSLTDFVILTSVSMTKEVFRMARRMGIIAKPYSWLVMNLGAEDIAKGILDDLYTSVTMLTFLKSDIRVKDVRSGHSLDRLGTALMADAMETVLRASEAHKSKPHSDMMQQIKQVRFQGETGLVHFDNEGRRQNFSLSIFEYDGLAFTKIGEWSQKLRSFDKSLAQRGDTSAGLQFPLRGKVAKVVIILERPFVMYKEDYQNRTGNDRFTGFNIDLLQDLSRNLDFGYDLYLVPDGQFGKRMPNGEWNGVIGEILAGNATMSMAPLSINSDREAVIDFTKPYKTRGITLLMKTPESHPSYFQFLDPFTPQVWGCTIMTLVILGFLLYVLEKYSIQFRKDMPRFTIGESHWFMFGSLVQGGTESSPVTMPGRVLTSAWWFFAMILVSTYTANLAAFLTVRKINTPISSVFELAEQSKIRYGTVLNSGVQAFFENTKVEPFTKMWATMHEVLPYSMVQSTEEGFDRVKLEEDYAFLWDDTVSSYIASVDCQVTEIGPRFDSKGLGIAVPQGAMYREEISLEILKLSDSGRIHELEDRWWGQTTCPDFSKPTADETSELALENVAGIFFVLIGGIVASFFAFIVDRLLYKAKRLKDKKKDNTDLTTYKEVAL